MGANVDKRSATKPRITVVPGGDAWERWDYADGAWKRGATGATPASLGLRRAQEFGVPSAGITTLPVSVTAPDFDALRGAVSLQMERRGLNPDDAGYSHIAEVSVEGERRFGLGMALTHDTLDAKQAIGSSRSSAAANMREWPLFSLVFWKELGSVVMGVTGERGLLYFHSLGNSSEGHALLLRARCHALWLSEMGWMDGVRQVIACFAEPEIEPLARSFGLPFAVIAEPPLSPPKTPWTLLPAAIVQREQKLKSAQRLRGVLSLVAVAAVAAGAVFAFQLIQLRLSLDRERKWLAANRSAIENVRAIAGRWNALDPAISPDAFPLELLQRCAALLPEDGARFTHFDWKDGVLAINGESVSPDIAYRYLESLKQNDATASIEWSMQAPTLQTNDLASFDIQGRTSYAPVVTE